jgi:SAM-dependent methyltransferase
MTRQPREWQSEADRLSRASIARGDPTGWFDQLYDAATAGTVTMPWDRTDPHPLLARWVEAKGMQGAGAHAVVVGCGLGADVAYLASRGFMSTGFDISETAIDIARARYPRDEVEFAVADLFDLPPPWRRAFDLVVEVFTVQALPDPPRDEAIRQVGTLVAPGGRLIAVEFRNESDVEVTDGPPWPLRRAEIDGFATAGLAPVRIEQVGDARWPDATFWLAEFERPQ